MMWFDKEKVTVPIVFGFRITCHRVDDPDGYYQNSDL